MHGPLATAGVQQRPVFVADELLAFVAPSLTWTCPPPPTGRREKAAAESRSFELTIHTMSSDFLVVVVLTTSTRLHFASAVVQPASTSWRQCLEVVLSRSSDPVHIVEQLCLGCGPDPSVILVCQPELRSVLLRRYAHDTVVLVEGASATGSARGSVWWPVVLERWRAALTRMWRVADMMYSHAKTRQCPKTTGLFDKYRYCRATAQEPRPVRQTRGKEECRPDV